MARDNEVHVLVLPFHGQGHINPMLQFSKRLASRGLKVTVAVTLSASKALIYAEGGPISTVPIYDDIRQGTFDGAGGFIGFFDRFQFSAYQGITEFVNRLDKSENPVKCLVYDANLPLAINVAKKLGLSGIAFFTQSCATIASYYPMYCEIMGNPIPENPVSGFSFSGLPDFGVSGLPELVPVPAGRYPPLIMHILKQFDHLDKADLIVFNSFDKLEEEVLKWMADKWHVHVVTIGPTVPSAFLDKRVENDQSYGFNLFNPTSDDCMRWLDTRDAGSVVFVSFGSAAMLKEEQMAQLAWALTHSDHNFLWVVRAAEEKKLPRKFIEEEASGKGLVVSWCSQLEVLAHRGIGCFVTHCGWNSTIEALSFGVPVVAMPQFLDQYVDAHFFEHVWCAGVRPEADAKGLVSGEEISKCIEEIMVGDKGKVIKDNAIRWKELAKEAVDEGGSSDKHIEEIVARLCPH